MQLDDLIKVYDNVVTPQNCSRVIDIFEQSLELHEHHDTEGYKFDQLNLRSNEKLLGLEKAFFATLHPIYSDYFTRLRMSKFVDIRAYEEIRIKKYVRNSSDVFKEHVDVMNAESARRFAIAILYLNDNDGFTEFTDSGIIVEPKAGRVVVFPPFWMFPHRGATPTNADKYIMMSCLHYV